MCSYVLRTSASQADGHAFQDVITHPSTQPRGSDTATHEVAGISARQRRGGGVRGSF
jgi:hypothetical protein